MDMRNEMTQFWTHLQASARGLASVGLEASSRALGFTAGHLTTLKEEALKTARRLKADASEGTTDPALRQ